ncbi:MAG: hypothetical protein AAF902_08385 [Chloroflexota bacterium]
MKFNTIIHNHKGHLFTFKLTDEKFVCHICYWRGHIEKSADGDWSAEILQKYDPFEHHIAESKFQSQDQAMEWVASQLVKKPEK